jgi:uncharacterized protein DUF4038/uncharacterized protein DUF5060
MRTVQVLFGLVLATGYLDAAPQEVTFSQSAQQVDAYDLVEVTANIAVPDVANAFTDATLSGSFENSSGRKWQVEGFCDSPDGRIFRIRFMPPEAGEYRFTAAYREANFERTLTGHFRGIDAHRRGPVRVDPQHPWHFLWEGTAEHYFFNGTTAYWLIGWKNDRVIEHSLERLHRLKINRVRVTIAGRTNMFYGEPVMLGENFTVYATPWPGKQPEDIYHPGFDYTRFDVAYWQKFELALRFARERDMIISVVLDMGDGKVHPAPASENEYRFIHYAVNRFGAFSNITWDLGDDLDHYRDDKWTHDTGTLIKKWDPYRHLATSHPVDNTHQDRTSDWFDFTSFQEWSRDQHNYMLSQRKQQEQTGRIIPQTNEEYGYEDHYPLWSRGLGSESAETLRRTAWDIVMAGGYQTAGESARRGTNVWPDTGGGWMNGRGDDTMTMFVGYAHMVDFFTSFDWWKTAPHDELVDKGKYCLSQPGEIYAIYLPNAGHVTVRLEPALYEATWFNAFTGEKFALGPVQGPSWTSPDAASHDDWALLLLKEKGKER